MEVSADSSRIDDCKIHDSNCLPRRAVEATKPVKISTPLSLSDYRGKQCQLVPLDPLRPPPL